MKLSLPPKLIVGLWLIVVVIELGAVEIYVVAVEGLRKKERQDETQFTTKIDGLFFMFFWISHCVWLNSGFWYSVFSYSTDNSNMASE
jgi:hypothetical protein